MARLGLDGPRAARQPERLFKGYFVVNTTFESAYGATYGAADWPEEAAVA